MQDSPIPATDDAFRITVIGSGSSGNCTLLSHGDTHVLIDAGFSGKQIAARMEMRGFDPTRLSAVLVTHEHSDHIKSVHTLSNRYKIPFFATEGTFAAVLSEKKFYDYHEIHPGRAFEIGKMTIHPITLPHDAADPVGFRVECADRVLGHITDFGSVNGLVTESLRGCDTLLVEANHDLDMLQEGPYPWPLKQRIASRLGHLSNDSLMELLPEILHEDVGHLFLAHLSEQNNCPKMLTARMRQILRRLGLPKLSFSIAQQHVPSETRII